jgi:hypothetical protein
MSGQQSVQEENALADLLAERFPWAHEARVKLAAERLEQHLDKSGVDDDEPYTVEMLESAQALGHQLAAVIGLPPGPYGAPGTPLPTHTVLSRLNVNALKGRLNAKRRDSDLPDAPLWDIDPGDTIYFFQSRTDPTDEAGQ